MPVIPTFTRSSRDRAAGSAPSIGAATAVSQAVGSVAGGVAQQANVFIQRQKDADNAAFVTESSNRLLREESERLADIETRGEDVDLTTLQTDYQDRVNELADLAPSQEAKNELLSQADNAFSRKFFPSYTRHQSGLNVKRRVDATTNGIDDIQSEVLTGRTGVSEAVARAESAIAGLAETAGGVVDIEALRQQARSGIGKAHLASRIQQGDGEAVIAEIQEGKWDDFTTTNELSAIQRGAIKAVADAESARQAETDKQNAIVASKLEVSVFRDQAGYQDIDDAMNAGIITPSKRTQLYKQLDGNSVKKATVADNLTRVQTSLSMGIPLDPTSKDDKAGVEQMWQSIAQDISQGDENDFANTAVSFVQSTGILPKSLKSTISAFSRSGDQGQAAQAADMIGRMQAVNSPALNDLTKESYAFGLSVESLVQGGVDPSKAVEIARESAFGQTQQDKKTTNLILKGASDDNVTFLNNQLDEFDPGIFSSQPEITPVLQAEFEVLLGEMLPFTNGNIDSARSMAWTSMRNVWGATTVNGGIQVMKYAPEAVYGKGGNTEWINEQFNSDMQGMQVDNGFIAVDIKTARSDQPSYPVFTRNNDGIIAPLLDEDNLPLRWKPEFSSSPAYQELKSEQDDNIRRAKFRRGVKRAGVERRQKRFERLGREEEEFRQAMGQE